MSQNVNEPLNATPVVHCSPEVLERAMSKAQEILATGGAYHLVFEDPVVVKNSEMSVGFRVVRAS